MYAFLCPRAFRDRSAAGHHHCSRRQLQQRLQSLLLWDSAGKMGHRRTFFIALQGSDCKAYSLSNF